MNGKMKTSPGTWSGGILTLLCLLVVSPTARGQVMGASLTAGQNLYAGQYLALPDGERTLEMETDGNLVLYGREVSRQLWQSGTTGHPGAHYVMQDDGNLVVYDTNNVPLWASGTAGNPGSQLVMGDDGNLAIYSPPRVVPLWASNTASHPGARYVMQDDGNLVIYDTGNVPLWASGTAGNRGATLFLDDGNLGILSAPQTNVVWQSGTSGNPGAQLEFVGGSLAIVSPSGVILWSTHTGGGWDHSGNSWQFTNGELQVTGYVGVPPYFKYVVLWRSGTAGIPEPSLEMQEDGNLVIRSVSRTVLWQTGTGGHTNAELVMQADGNLVVNSAPEPQLLWQSHTGGNPGAQLVMQADGNLVVRGPVVRKSLWSTGTSGHPGACAKMQTDGNLVIYDTNGVALWASRTGRNPPPPSPHLDLQQDGNLVIYWAAGQSQACWATGTCSAWMEKLGDAIFDFSLRKLVLPGSHDSGTWGLDDTHWADDGNVPKAVFDIDGYLPGHVEIHWHWIEHHTSWWPHIAYWTLDISITPHAQYMYSFARTQGYDFSAQLNNGIRYFDMRVLDDGGNLYLIHTERGPSVYAEINEINDYLRENPYEIVILDFQHFYTQSGSDSTIPDDQNRQLCNYIMSKLGDLLIPPPAAVNQLTVGDIWTAGKQVVVFYAQDPPSGVDTSKFWSRDNLLRSEWLDQQSLYGGGGKAGLKNAIDAEAAAYAESTDKLWVVQGILTFNPGTLVNYLVEFEWSQLAVWLGGNRGAADSVNDWVKDWALTSTYASHVNILLGDWAADSQLVQTAVAANLLKAGLDPLHPGIDGLPLFDSMPMAAPQTPLEGTVRTVPVVIPPPDLVLDATGRQTPVDLGAALAYDPIDGWLESQAVAVAASYPIGEHQITWAAQDAAGVAGSALQTIWIVACKPQADKTVLWPVNHRMVKVTIKANVVRALRGKVTLSASIQSSQSATGKGCKNRGGDWSKPKIDQKAGTIRLDLRAEHQGDEDRVYTITVTATDAQGNRSDAVVQVRVPTHQEPKGHGKDKPPARVHGACD